ncbi:hypothetical protein PAPYR_13177 [Paratrimastix pyriformis]|uniref:Uncharacterized protein n=1 Tax=Paratrimastix pyriformis TaxID=342808 RepID=A0ABQ8U0P2_9EUKA|nr:hypothetical protein PAPYR_13177 [Paratrimastix pyriformis]
MSQEQERKRVKRNTAPNLYLNFFRIHPHRHLHHTRTQLRFKASMAPLLRCYTKRPTAHLTTPLLISKYRRPHHNVVVLEVLLYLLRPLDTGRTNKGQTMVRPERPILPGAICTMRLPGRSPGCGLLDPNYRGGDQVSDCEQTLRTRVRFTQPLANPSL